VSFQVDSIDWSHRSGWSVLVHGDAYEATHWETHHLGLEPWAGGDKSHWVRLKVRDISGRRIEPAELVWPPDESGYPSPPLETIVPPQNLLPCGRSIR
jgi:uncharacterized protein